MAQWMLCTFGWLDVLGKSWWQGIAGVAQILAAAISVYLVGLAFKERRESVAPDWEVHPTKIENLVLNPGGISHWNAFFLNTGWGPALRTKAWYKNKKTGLKNPLSPKPAMVPSGEWLTVYIEFKEPILPGDEIIITSLSRLNREVTYCFALTPPIKGSLEVTLEKTKCKCRYLRIFHP